MAAVPTSDTSGPAGPSRPRRIVDRLRPAAIPFVVLLLAGAILLASTNWNSWVASRPVQTTDDAQLRADITQLSTKGSGIVSRVAVSDYQSVKAGDLIVQLDDSDFRAQVDVAEAAVHSAEAALVTIRVQKDIQASKIAEAGANINAANADLERTKRERLREEALESDRVSTRQKVEAAVADHERFRATLLSRQAELQTQRRQVAALDAQDAQLLADLKAKQSQLNLANVNLSYTRIVAPTDGVVGERKVRPGQLVSPGTQVISLVGNDVWVIANFRENQVANLRVGERADVRVDGVADVVWRGHVETISPASGAQFSLLPPDNATGNYTKIAQRIPVKIVLDPGQGQADRLRSGMSVIASVKTKQ
jgi:membrane fusion protein (multidrug efflux system)